MEYILVTIDYTFTQLFFAAKLYHRKDNTIMKLLTKELMKKLPALYSQEGVEDKKIPVKFFDSMGSWTWYVTEGCPRVENTAGEQREALSLADIKDDEKISDWLFFGLVDGFEKEWGYFVLSELESVRSIERDKFWDSNTLMSQLKNGSRS